MQYDFGFAPRPKLTLGEIETVIRKYRIIVPCPSRQTLITYCEDGLLEAIKPRGDWLVFEDSFKSWVRSMQSGEKMAA